jgi:indole-3-acetate monooxygenase
MRNAANPEARCRLTDDWLDCAEKRRPQLEVTQRGLPGEGATCLKQAKYAGNMLYVQALPEWRSILPMRDDQIPAAAKEILDNVRALEPDIRQSAEAIERERQLPDKLAHQLMEAQVFRLGLPRAYGGPELDPMCQVRIVEELSRIEGSVGWLSMISSAGSFLGAFLDPPVAQRFFGSVDNVLAGNLRPPQRADLIDGGYRVSGRFHFGSGCQHASMMACGCVIYEFGQPQLNRRGEPQIRVMLIPASKATIVDVWDTTGMRGTGSNDYIVDNVFVPFEESPNMAEPPKYRAPLYAFPQMFLVSHAGVPLGIARSALNFVIDLSTRKETRPGKLLRDDTLTQETIAWAEAHLGAARAFVYSTLEDLWATLSAGGRLTPLQHASYRLMITYSHQAAKDLISKLYDVAATSSIFRSGRLDRDMRDIMTACQHRVVHLKMYRPAGRMLLGLDADEPFF